MTLVVRAATLYNTRELVRVTHLAMLEDIMADKLAKERFCSNKISYLQWIKDCLVSQQSQLRLSDHAYQSW